MAWVDVPAAGTRVQPRFEVRGWAFKEGAGVSRIEVTLDGEAIGEAAYGTPFDVGGYFPGSVDPNQPNVGFSATVDAPPGPSGRRWLGLRLHGGDGSVESWPEQAIEVEPVDQ